ncbi:MAG: SH3 domain-containing protein [Caldilineaceae bacterium]
MKKPLITALCLMVAVLFWADGMTLAVYAQSAAQSSGEIAVVSAQGGVLQAESGATIVPLPPGELLVVQGRSDDSQFLFVQTEQGRSGWVDVNALLIVNIGALPVIDMVATRLESPASETEEIEGAVGTTLIATAVPQAVTLVATVTPAVASQNGTSAIRALVTLTTSRLNLRAGPGTAYPTVAKAEPGSRWIVLGQTKAGDWLEIQSLVGTDSGWAAATYLQLEGSGALPVVTDFPAPPVTTTRPVTEAPQPSGRTLLPTPVAGVGESGTAVDITGDNSVTLSPVQAPGKTGLSGLLAFQDRIGGMIYLYDLHRDRLTPLTGGIDPALSPDGQHIAFTRDGGDGGLYVINRDGSGEQRIYNDHPLLRAPSWSPDGQWIVFSRANGFEDCRVVRGSVCLPDSAIIESLPDELQGDALVEKLVKDIPNQRTYHTSLARIAPDGSGYRDIPAIDYAAAPDWSTGGIVYQSNAGIQRTADEADVRSVEIANDPLVGYFHDPDWQPGGGRIAFHRKQGSHWQIYAVNPDGSGLVALTRPVTALVDELPSNVSPAWSPDGQQIIYLSNRNSIESAGAWHFWVMNADGSDQRMLPIDVVLEYTFSSEQMVSWAAAP